MAHHQHHGMEYDAQVSRSLQTRPTSTGATRTPTVTEEELAADPDEPPDHKPHFTKTILTQGALRQSLLTKALHLDSDVADEQYPSHYFNKLPSVSSTCSTHSVRSIGDFTSDDGHVSPSTRASTPGSPRSLVGMPKLSLGLPLPPPATSDAYHESDASRASIVSENAEQEATVEAKLGRKRCIMFACGRKDSSSTDKKQTSPTLETAPSTPLPPVEKKRPCTIKFACPFKPSNSTDVVHANANVPQRTVSRHLSPPPSTNDTSARSATTLGRRHRDSDATVRNGSPTTPRATYGQKHMRDFDATSELQRTEACRFHEFASEEEEHEDWTQESTCYRTRLTVNDTLKKEMDIRKLAEEADEEEALEHEFEMDDDEDDEDLTDDGFQTDDEEGFADSDEEEDDDSDYEWWAPSKSRMSPPPNGHSRIRPVATRAYSGSSDDESDDNVSPGDRRRGRQPAVTRTRPVQIRPASPDLPDSTDFVCGTLDEDRPLEAAYLSKLEQKKAAKHRSVPQDIDPSFPVSDPEMASDDDEDEIVKVSASAAGRKESAEFIHGQPDVSNDEEEERRGRQRNSSPYPTVARTPCESPERQDPSPVRRTSKIHFSPPPISKKSILINRSPAPSKRRSCAEHRSPAPLALFNHRSPRRYHSPRPAARLTSPPPSRRGSLIQSQDTASVYNVPMLGRRNDELTHTASLPRSPAMIRRRRPSHQSSNLIGSPQSNDPLGGNDEEDDDDSLTDRPSSQQSKPTRYTRGAMDIAQGLERKRLKRRELFYKQYCRKEEKRERSGKAKRPVPGKGAQRMRQVGLECAVYRGARMLSI